MTVFLWFIVLLGVSGLVLIVANTEESAGKTAWRPKQLHFYGPSRFEMTVREMRMERRAKKGRIFK